MRIWHYALLPYLPDLQFKGQLRELVAIMHDWRDKGKTNHILINQVTEYSKVELYDYFCLYAETYEERYHTKLNIKYYQEFFDFAFKDDMSKLADELKIELYEDWHDYGYLRICMANLLEKHYYGRGKSRISDEEWKRLVDGYQKITGQEYIFL